MGAPAFDPLAEVRFTEEEVEQVLDGAARANDLRECWVKDILRRFGELRERRLCVGPLVALLQDGTGLTARDVANILYEEMLAGRVRITFPGASQPYNPEAFYKGVEAGLREAAAVVRGELCNPLTAGAVAARVEAIDVRKVQA